MNRTVLLATCAAAVAAAALSSRPAHAQEPSPLAGVWSLDCAASELAREIGFDMPWTASSSAASGHDQAGDSPGGGRGRQEQGGSQAREPVFGRPESYQQAQLINLLTGEAQNPPARLTIADTSAAVTMTNELGQSLTLHPNGKAEAVEIQRVPVEVTARRMADGLEVDYRVDQNRQVRYTYSFADPSRLVVDVQFLDRGTGEKARRVYRRGLDADARAAGGASPGPSPARAGAPAAAAPSAAPPPGGVAPAAGAQQAALDQSPGAELKGLTTLGIVVERLSPQAAACGLDHDTIENALAKRLTDGGFTVRRNSDEDTYVYVNVMTTSLPGGLCVSRYDAFLYSYARATLSYRDRPVLAQVSLIHRGGIGGGLAATHGAAVQRDLESYVDLFVSQIHDANK